MNDLDYKFRKNKVSPEELKKLREQIDSMDNKELEELLAHSWFDEEIDTSNITDEQIDRIKRSIDKNILPESKKQISWVSKVARIAAAILLPVFILTTFYLYRENNQLVSEEMIVSTGKGERANITLPDGTSVSLNSESRLSYIPKVYNKKERKIGFDGEGYFQVYKNIERSFIIDAKGMQVKVLGTTFNLAVRELENIAELSLEEGSVLLHSILTNENVILKPSQKAILDQLTGNITVIKEDNIRDASAWKRGDMVFRNTSLVNVIRTIEDNYNVNIQIDCDNCPDDSFTGTVPINDLNEVLEIIERSYHLKATIKGKEIVLGLR